MLRPIGDFLYLSCYFLRALFKSRESLERESGELRRQLKASKAEVEAEQAKEGTKRLSLLKMASRLKLLNLRRRRP
jgi:hypothetical protein